MRKKERPGEIKPPPPKIMTLQRVLPIGEFGWFPLLEAWCCSRISPLCSKGGWIHPERRLSLLCLLEAPKIKPKKNDAVPLLRMMSSEGIRWNYFRSGKREGKEGNKVNKRTTMRAERCD